MQTKDNVSEDKRHHQLLVVFENGSEHFFYIFYNLGRYNCVIYYNVSSEKHK